MDLPIPVPGLVVRYGYLWHSEHLDGKEGGGKDRPCAIVGNVLSGADGKLEILVLPITHTLPKLAEMAVEIPAAVRKRLGLDDEESWVIISEWNQFVWPGPDLRPSRPENRTPDFGMLPPGLFNSIRQRFLILAKAGRARRVRRTQ